MGQQSTGRAERRLRAGALAAAAAAISAIALPAQAPTTDAAIPLPSHVRRQPLLPQVGSEGGETRSLRVYRWDGPIDVLFRWYLGRLRGQRQAAVDTAYLRPDESTPVKYDLAFHSFEDQCADSAAPATCTVWRRAKDKRRTLNRAVGLEPGLWIERATFTWFSRATQGDLVQWRVELNDAGLSDDWQRYTPAAQLTVERVLLNRDPRR